MFYVASSDGFMPRSAISQSCLTAKLVTFRVIPNGWQNLNFSGRFVLSLRNLTHFESYRTGGKLLIFVDGSFYRSEFGQLELSHCSIFELSNWQEAGD